MIPRASSCSKHYKRVEDFMTLAGQVVREKPELPTGEERRLRARLILEEALETIEALGFQVEIPPTRDLSYDLDSRDAYKLLVEEGAPNLVEVADGCADLSVVTVGTLVSCGIADLPLLGLVDENNLSKFGPGGYRDAKGKWIKPPGHLPPDIAGLLAKLA